jgi:hypothetical protein
MAVTATYELTRGRSVSGNVGETSTYARLFAVRVDDPGTSLLEISTAPGVSYYDEYPGDSSVVCTSFDCQAADDSGMWYTVSMKYSARPVWGYGTGGQPPDPADPLRLPEDQWSAAASISSGPVTRDIDGKPIVNSAKDPIGGLQKDYAEMRITLVKAYPDLSWAGQAFGYTNTVNGSAWNGSAPRTWKCHFQSAQKQTENNQGGTLTYWSVVWDFVLRADTWDLKEGCEDVGMMEIAVNYDGDTVHRNILVDGDPVSAPVALLPSGEAAPVGTEPSIINGGQGVQVYRLSDFSIFGVPS